MGRRGVPRETTGCRCPASAATVGSLRNVERDLLAAAARYRGLQAKKNREIGRLGNPSPGDPTWRALDEMFGSRARREVFVSLLLKTREAPGHIKSIGEGSKDAGEEKDAVEVEIPASLLVEILAGRTTLIAEYARPNETYVVKALHDGWGIEDCRFVRGNIQAGEADMVVLTRSPVPAAYTSTGRTNPTVSSFTRGTILHRISAIDDEAYGESAAAIATLSENIV